MPTRFKLLPLLLAAILLSVAYYAYKKGFEEPVPVF